MADNKKFTIQAVFEAVDKSSSTIKKLSAGLKSFGNDSKNVSKALGEMGQNSVLTKLSGHFKNMKSGVGEATQSVFGLKEGLVALGGFASVAGMVEVVKNFAALGGEARRTASMLGMTTEAVQQYAYAGAAAGVGSEEFDHLMVHLSRSTADASKGLGEHAALFTALGISVRKSNGEIKNVDHMLPELADKISKIKSPILQAQVATELFGRAGVELLPFLKKGSAGIEELKSRSSELGLVMNDKMIAHSKEWTEANRDLSASMTGISNIVADRILPLITPILNGITNFIKNNKHLTATLAMIVSGVTMLAGAFVAVGVFLSGLSTVISIAVGGFEAIGAVIGVVVGAIGFIPLCIAAAIAAVGVGAYQIWKHWDWIKGKTVEIWDNIKDYVVGIIDKICNYFDDKIQKIKDTFQKLGLAVGDSVTTVSTVVRNAGHTVGEKASGALNYGKEAVSSSASAIMDKFKSMGWGSAPAAGLAASVIRESNGNPNAVGDGGKAYGIGQWHPDRQAEFTRVFGKSIKGSSLDEQLNFMNYELKAGNEQGAGRKLASANDAYSAGSIVSKYYERPADKEGEASYRGGLAQNLYQANNNNKPESLVRLKIDAPAGLNVSQTGNDKNVAMEFKTGLRKVDGS